MASSQISTCRKRVSSIDAVNEGILQSALRRDRAVVLAALGLLTALAWAYTLWLASSMDKGLVSQPETLEMGAMLAPAFRPWTGAEFAVTLVMWAAMMVAMMTPSATPMILLYARVGRQAALQEKPFAGTGFFAAGYLIAWSVFSLAATIGQWVLERLVLLTPMMATASDILGGLILIVAGLFQWTPVKDSCLRHCQAPLSFIQRHGGFRREPSGALILGLRHGMYCVGCCWALMTLLFVGGVMNVIWIAALTLFVMIEKITPAGRVFSRTVGAGLAIWGTWLLIAVRVPQ